MSNIQTVSIDTIRTVGEASIGATYAAVGSAFTHGVRLICFTNNTDGDMFFSDDGVNDKLFVAAGSFKLFDLNTNRTNQQQFWVFPPNTQFYVRYSSMPSKGSVYLECLWGQ
jgi:hypothetical protein